MVGHSEPRAVVVALAGQASEIEAIGVKLCSVDVGAARLHLSRGIL